MLATDLSSPAASFLEWTKNLPTDFMQVEVWVTSQIPPAGFFVRNQTKLKTTDTPAGWAFDHAGKRGRRLENNLRGCSIEWDKNGFT